MNFVKELSLGEARGMTMKVSSLLLCLTVISLASMLYGQGGATGTILGTVTDNTGAVAGDTLRP